MPDHHQCDNCGAILAKDDLFCGECGAPQPAAQTTPEAVEASPAPSAAPGVEPAPKAGSPSAPAKSARTPAQLRTAGIIAVTLAVTVAVLLCAMGLFTAFLVPDGETGMTATQDMFIFSGLCCFCPGALALVVAVVVWVLVIRGK
jgi:hypothetical protein